MIITGASTPPIGVARATANGAPTAAASLVPTPDKNEVSAGAAKALSSPLMSGDAQLKTQARARVQALVERLKILKKLYAYNPQGMAKALAQVFKELKAAVQDYARAGGDEMGVAGSAAEASAGTSASGGDGATGGSGGGAGGQGGPAPQHALYEAVTGEVRRMVGEDGLEFVKEVRELTNSLSGLLETARTQARIKKPDDAMKHAFEDADDGLKSLRDAMSDMEQDIHRSAPTAGMKLSVAA